MKLKLVVVVELELVGVLQVAALQGIEEGSAFGRGLESICHSLHSLQGVFLGETRLELIHMGAVAQLRSDIAVCNDEHNLRKDIGRESMAQGGFHTYAPAYIGSLYHSNHVTHFEGAQSSGGLLGSEEGTLVLKFLGALFISLQGGGHQLIISPLIANEEETVIGLGVLYILVRYVNELSGQFVLLLQGGIGQGSVDGVLGQFRTLFSAEGGIQVFTRTHEGGAYIVNGDINLVHLVQNLLELGNFTSHLVGHIHQGAELLGARLHHHISSHNTISVRGVALDQFFHIGDILDSRLAGETGTLADVATCLTVVDGPVDEVGKNQARGAHGHYGTQNDNTFLAFHGNMD